MVDRFNLCQILLNQSLHDAMVALDHSGTEITLVIDEEGRLAGTLTDGDIRRALLSGCSFSAQVGPYMQRQYTSVTPEAGRMEVVELMQARGIRQIPVLNEDNRPIGLHLMHELIGQSPKPNWAVIMAGGQGTRLRPITEKIPKPMVRVAGRPILERIILHLVGFGFHEIFISVNYLSHIIKEHFADGKDFGCRIHYLEEEKPLGTGGALALLPDRPSFPILVMNGDLVTQIKADQLLDYHDQGGFMATLCMRRYLHSVPFGCLSLSERGTVVGLEEKPVLERWVNAGIYIFSPEAVELVPKEFFPLTQLIEILIDGGHSVGAFEILQDWIDVGQKEQLAAAQGHI